MTRRIVAACFWLAVAHAGGALERGGQPPAESDEVPFECRRSTAQGTFSGYQVTEENDSIIGKGGGDERYTQGLRLAFHYHPQAVPCFVQRTAHWLKRRVRPSAEAFDTGFSLATGHNLYTPGIITSRTLDPGDRGFADFTYLGAQLSLTATDRSARHLFDVSAGALGKEGLAKGAQGGLHALKLARIPKGWYSTQPKTVGVNARYRLERRVFCNDLDVDEEGSARNCKFDLTGGHAAELGNVRTSLGLHATARVGWGLTGFPAAVIPTAADAKQRRRFEVGALIGVEGRGIAHTNLVQETPGSTGFEKERLVGDVHGGFYARVGSLRATYQRVRRTAEFRIPGVAKRNQDFASISLSYEPESVVAQPKPRSWMFRDWQLELGMGTNLAGPKLDAGNQRGITAQLVARKGLAWGFKLGLFELAAATVEGAPTPGQPGDRSDIFLRQRAVTLGWGTGLAGGRAGRIAVRGGSALWGGDARIQTIFHRRVNGRREESVVDQDFRAPRGGWLVGGQYFLPLEPRLSIGADVSYHSLKLAERVPGVAEPRFLKLVIAAQVRP